MNAPFVSTIVLNFNGKEYLQRCFSSLEGEAYPRMEIIMVDNGSTDGSAAFVRENFPQVRLIENASNLGFAEPCNQGSRIAKGKYLFFLNNDATLEEDCLKELVAFMEKKRGVALVGPAVYEENKGKLESAGFFPTLPGFFYHPSLPTKKPFEVFGVTGVAMLVRGSVFKKVGGFDPDFFAYSEDADLCTRVEISGGKIYALPSAKVIHLRGQTSQRLDKSFVVYHATKNRILLLLKNFGLPLLAVILPIHFLFLLLGVLFFLLSGKAREAWAMVRGIWWNIKKLPMTLKKRGEVQSLRTVSDRLLFKRYFKILPIDYLLKTAYTYIKEW